MSSSREWISTAGPRGQRHTILTFVLSKPALVEFVLFRVSPDCRPVGRFRVHGRAGTNRVRFRGRVNGRALRAGTYVIRAHALPARGRTLAKTKLVIFKRKPLAQELAAAQASNTCRSLDEGASAGTSSSSALWGGTGLFGSTGKDGKLGVSQGEGSSIRVGGSKNKTPAAVLGVRFTRAADAVKKVPALLFVLLGLAIGLLAAAAMPLRFVPNDRMAAVLAYRRTFVALVGAITLASVALVYALA
ncbi:MAG: hypothetical protein H0V11_02365 [Actinobacteria bacterium]|nr:hypothetical protein [Actinomycetota bacterium]